MNIPNLLYSKYEKLESLATRIHIYQAVREGRDGVLHLRSRAMSWAGERGGVQLSPKSPPTLWRFPSYDRIRAKSGNMVGHQH